ncbi:MAG: PfkB domain protein [Microbacteriaceae bacterium]|nr:PfkB domain protein [Microbacteriaceae bacterium]
MRVSALPKPGETIGDGMLSIGPGGKGSNQAVGMARLGATVSLFSAIGSDAGGDDGIRLWDAEGVDHSGVKRGTAATMTGFILVDRSAENSIAIAPGALDELVEADADRFGTTIAESDLLVISLELPAAVATRLMLVARQAGVRVLLNPAPAIGGVPWQSADILTPNRGEAATLLGLPADTEPSVLAARLAEASGALVVMTLGADGVLVHDGASVRHIPAPAPRAVVDTTGAGDAFTAALAVALCSGSSAHDAAAWAAAAGAHSVAYREVIPGLARLHDLPPLPPPETRPYPEIPSHPETRES